MDEQHLPHPLPALYELPLFEGIAPDNIPHVLGVLRASHHFYESGQTIHYAGDITTDCLYVLDGAACLAATDNQGRKSILCEYGIGDAIAIESLFFGSARLIGDVIARKPTTVMAISMGYAQLGKSNDDNCLRIVRHNLAETLSRTNQALLEHLSIVSRRTTREKLLAYLALESDRAGSATFVIPHSRQELADYLHVERTALSHELGKLQAEGLIDYRRDTFTLSDRCLDNQGSGPSR